MGDSTRKPLLDPRTRGHWAETRVFRHAMPTGALNLQGNDLVQKHDVAVGRAGERKRVIFCRLVSSAILYMCFKSKSAVS